MLLVIIVASCSSTKPDKTPPDSPLSLLATRGDGRISLNWTNVTADDLEGYYVYHRPQAGGTEIRSDLVVQSSTEIRDLENGTAYVFYVTAVDGAGNESDPSPEATATPNNEVSLTAQGWTAWELGDYENAMLLFNDALNFDTSYPDAYNGMGWTSLRQGDLQTAGTRFETAITNGLTTQDAYAGGLAVYRDVTGKLPLAMTYGVTLLNNDPLYVFSHDTTIDADVVRLMLAQVFFRLGESFFTDAQDLMDDLVPANGLDPADSATWLVDGSVYQTYASALLALIQYAFSVVSG
jgi:tetratricopeptide (TPR) repeat protein